MVPSPEPLRLQSRVAVLCGGCSAYLLAKLRRKFLQRYCILEPDQEVPEPLDLLRLSRGPKKIRARRRDGRKASQEVSYGAAAGGQRMTVQRERAPVLSAAAADGGVGAPPALVRVGGKSPDGVPGQAVRATLLLRPAEPAMLRRQTYYGVGAVSDLLWVGWIDGGAFHPQRCTAAKCCHRTDPHHFPPKVGAHRGSLDDAGGLNHGAEAGKLRQLRTPAAG